MKKISICQSNYIPWKGYFDLITSGDTFVIYDHVQYTKNDWRNRNMIKTKNGLQWLTIPVKHDSKDQTIRDTRIAWNKWNIKHWKTIKSNYSKAPFFSEYSDYFENLYLTNTSEFLSEVNYTFLKSILDFLGMQYEIIWSDTFSNIDNKNLNLIQIVNKLNGDIYLSGPSAKDYINESSFNENGIQLEWMNYGNYPEYTQIHNSFEHGVSILDLIFNVGKQEAIKNFKVEI